MGKKRGTKGGQKHVRTLFPALERLASTHRHEDNKLFKSQNIDRNTNCGASPEANNTTVVDYSAVKSEQSAENSELTTTDLCHSQQ